jgi:sodium-dependent dicarboxylate transporter 2/3/5
MESVLPTATSLRVRWALALIAAVAGVWGSFVGFEGAHARAAGAITAVCLALWLSEVVPSFVPTLVLVVAAPLALAPDVEMRTVLGWMADPVLALFFGGFVLGEAAAVHGLARLLATTAVRGAGGRARWLVAGAAAMTAFLSMWMSNVAAAALMFACVQPMFPEDSRLRRAVLVAVALGANLGGMATPISSGPNAIAIAAMERSTPFLSWMVFAVPLLVGSLAVAVVLLVLVHRVRASDRIPTITPVPEGTGVAQRPVWVAVVAAVAILAWVTEPLHGVPAPIVSMALAVTLFATRLVPAERIRHLDWGTLLLIAGGVGLGRLAEATGLIDPIATALVSAGEGPVVRLAVLVFASAVLASVMSNTGTAALMVPLSVAVLPEVPTAPILIALASSYGMPFVVSTPPNAMAVGAGARGKDLLLPGLVLLVAGCLILALTGPYALKVFGVG